MKTKRPNARFLPGKSVARTDRRIALPPIRVSRATLAKLKRWSALYDGSIERTLEAAVDGL